MLSEARARLANTQGKKAKRKARERQLEESRRLAVLQKRRELKNAGINTKVITRKKGQMDYNADIPFEKAPAPGFFDTQEEELRNERQREMFDPQKQQLANKRKGDPDEDAEERKRRKNNKSGPSAASAAAAKAGQMQKLREAEQSSKRRSLVLPAPQVSESELEEIVKMGMTGERASQIAGSSENEATRGLVGNYSNIIANTPIRTPRAPQEEDRIANEIRNARARTETQSALLGGENTPLYEGNGSTGFEGVAPSRQQIFTPNPMATPFRQAASGVEATPLRTPAGVAATPLRTPRDNFRLNANGEMMPPDQTPRDIMRREKEIKQSVKSKLASLPKPKETEWELELPEEQQEVKPKEISAEDAAERDRRDRAIREAADRAEFLRQTQVLQRALPRPSILDLGAMLETATGIQDPTERAVTIEMAQLMANDLSRHGGGKILGTPSRLQAFDEDALNRAKMEIALEISNHEAEKTDEDLNAAWMELHGSSKVPGLAGYAEDEIDEHQLMVEMFDVCALRSATN